LALWILLGQVSACCLIRWHALSARTSAGAGDRRADARPGLPGKAAYALLGACLLALVAVAGPRAFQSQTARDIEAQTKLIEQGFDLVDSYNRRGLL
jgi:hypothetical protein